MKINTNAAGQDMPVELAKYRTFSRLTTDWVWELDAELSYRFHSAGFAAIVGLHGSDLIGRARIDVLNERFTSNESLSEHHQCLLQRKPVDLVLTATIQSDVKYVRVIAEPQFDESGSFTGYLGCECDVTQQVKRESELCHMASHDDLTGVLNRRAFERELGVRIHQVRSEGATSSLCLIDLDRFKQVNDEGGHQAGDQLLREIVGVIQKHIQPEDVLARMGGDEFALLLSSNASCAVKVLDKIIDAIATYNFNWHGKTLRVGASVGIAAITEKTVSTETLMLEADNACYAAKNNGRNQTFLANTMALQVSDASEKQQAHSSVLIKNALENKQFKLLVQPIVSTSKHEDFDRYEILLRLQCANGELLEPGVFMPVAITYGLQQAIDCWVVENALEVLEKSSAQSNDIAFTINLTASTLASEEALDKLVKMFSSYQIPKNRVCIDITESNVIRNLDVVFSFMDKLKSLGVEFALDDFGNSISSLTYLHKLPINYLKFDGELIRRLSTDETVRSITASIAELGRKLGIETIAESVEDSATADYVKDLEIDYMQGFGVASLFGIESLHTTATVRQQ